VHQRHYLINIALFKGHSLAVTLTAKNHFAP
jgi:hypothetical protein